MLGRVLLLAASKGYIWLSLTMGLRAEGNHLPPLLVLNDLTPRS
ncbi:hypothetical protein GMORB2_1664 [Geosmithia morbida]|uniref:Uncharacterized protein n=1 Tax=Geosmithia morbida TaxID=1094350 RepID=A0A9P4YU49_9HYPO|nr:uncharacterized protein GMORB2_1664 [Geosmithia morbida]KAF4121824.1 hypothetical protein GMORB2_1664 [Geosmithia morbida]